MELQRNPNYININPKEWATKIRRNLLLHAGIPGTPYFLLADGADFFYWWKIEEPVIPERAADYVVAAHEILATYLSQVSPGNGASQSYRFKLTIASWLGELVDGKI